MGAGRKWSESEERTLRTLWMEGRPRDEIAEACGRPWLGVRARALALELPPRRRAPSPEPARDYVLQVAKEEAQASRATLTDILDMIPTRAAFQARLRCWTRIKAETGCSCAALARAWGCCAETIRLALSGKKGVWIAARPAPVDPIQAQTLARLAWQYGSARAEDIAAGRDLKTNEDIQSWNRLCGRKAA